jgi:hypothetical protein
MPSPPAATSSPCSTGGSAPPRGAMASLILDAPTGDAARLAITALIELALRNSPPLRG